MVVIHVVYSWTCPNCKYEFKTTRKIESGDKLVCLNCFTEQVAVTTDLIKHKE